MLVIIGHVSNVEKVRHRRDERRNVSLNMYKNVMTDVHVHVRITGEYHALKTITTR